MDYEKTLPATGLGTLTIGGMVMQQLWLPLLALGVVIVAAALIRLLFRRGKHATDA